jgi:hypothetical protein
LIAIEEIRETKSLWVPHKNYPNLRRNGVWEGIIFFMLLIPFCLHFFDRIAYFSFVPFCDFFYEVFNETL